jgi:predicted dehydrogenase|tara:strand:- start:1052 stop:1984 length:933 start_codon:yes stop_codon:yes gene_type:complete
MKVTIIGYKNHSTRLHKILESMGVDSHMWNHHKDDFSKVIGSDCVLISSPSNTHIKYIKRILKESPNSYIFCEKPPTTNIEDLKYLKGLSSNIKEMIFFNYNYRFSLLSELVGECDLGKPVHFNFISSHGLALKDSYKDNWRFSPTNELLGVYGTVAIHYIDLCLWLLGEYESININKHNYSNSKTSDSITIDMKFKNGCTTNIFVSYVTPFVNKADLIFDDGILELDNGKIKLYEPRESFDENGYFTKPHSRCIVDDNSSKDYYDVSLKKSLSFFIDNVREKNKFNVDDFNMSVKSNEILLNKIGDIDD